MSESLKRKNSTKQDPKDILKITPLGAGSEVGRSCILIQYKGKTVMLDCGIHPAYDGLAALPFFDEIDPATVDVLLISHFHLDHAASLPYFTEKTTFKGRVFMTHPTKAIYKWLLSDFVKVSNIGVDDMLFDENDLLNSYEKIEAIDFHQHLDVDGIQFTAYNAGHVLGAAMFVIEIAGIQILYTGDYSREEDRHLMAAERPPGLVPDVMICESTYGVQSNEPREQRESRFTHLVHDTVLKGGRCLIPAFALGRAQELLLILDEYWQQRPELHHVPVYYASALAKKCLTIYQTFVNMMNQKIRKQFTYSNPFIFKHISNLKSIEQFDDNGPCVMMASPAMLQSGLSRQLFERWCTDKRNSVIIPGYVVDGTLANTILHEPEEVPSMDGRRLPLNMKVEYISFSAHVDYTQNSEFISEMKPVNLVLVHGETNAMNRLKSALIDKNNEKQQNLKIYTPQNCESVTLFFRGEKMAKVIGRLASIDPLPLMKMEGLLVGKDFHYHIMRPEDLDQFTELKPIQIMQKQCVAFQAPFSLVKLHLQQMFGPVIEEANEKQENLECIRVLDVVEVKKFSQGELILEWKGDAMNDMIADAIVAVILQIDSLPNSVKITKSEHHHEHEHLHQDTAQEKRDFIFQCLKSHFIDNTDDNQIQYKEKNLLHLLVDDEEAEIDLKTLKVECKGKFLRKRLENLLQEIALTLTPLGEFWELSDEQEEEDPKK